MSGAAMKPPACIPQFLFTPSSFLATLNISEYFFSNTATLSLSSPSNASISF
jgi:hypothetical protein